MLVFLLASFCLFGCSFNEDSSLTLLSLQLLLMLPVPLSPGFGPLSLSPQCERRVCDDGVYAGCLH